VQSEADKFGAIASIVIPHPPFAETDSAARGEVGGAGAGGGYGRVFVRYGHVLSAAGALTALNGRKYAQNRIVAHFYDEAKFALQQYDA
jgi:hypothetical protein